MEVVITLQLIDKLMIGVYAAIILGLGFWLSRTPPTSSCRAMPFRRKV